MTEELVRYETQANEALMPAMEIGHALQRYNQMKAFIQQVLLPDTDFGVIPGTTKPTLLKPGAEKLTSFFGLSVKFTELEVIQDWAGKDYDGEPFFSYRHRCHLCRGDMLIAEADGACNSWESKYRWRKAERLCPKCGTSSIIKSKRSDGWYCFPKIGGCGANFEKNDPAIVNQEVGRVPNRDIFDQVNTLLKMSEKRALIAATLIAVNASEYFTQDLEDLDYGVIVTGEVVDNEPAQRSAPTPQPKPTNGEQATQQVERPFAAEKLRSVFAAHVADAGNDGMLRSDEQGSLIAGKMNECFAGESEADNSRRSVLKYLTGKDSSKTLTKTEARVILDWLVDDKNDTDDYPLKPHATQEAHNVLRAVLAEAGQQELQF